jgi:hypothetical protein
MSATTYTNNFKNINKIFAVIFQKILMHTWIAIISVSKMRYVSDDTQKLFLKIPINISCQIFFVF